MANKNKAQSTREESWWVTLATQRGLSAWRLSEGGMYDGGDVVIVDAQGDHWVVEVKASERESLHPLLHKTRAKLETADLPFVPYDGVVAHKRLVPVEDGLRRVKVGEARVVAMTPEAFLALLGGTV